MRVLYTADAADTFITRYSPLVDTTMEIKYEITIAHLWFEEIISGDSSKVETHPQGAGSFLSLTF